MTLHWLPADQAVPGRIRGASMPEPSDGERARRLPAGEDLLLVRSLLQGQRGQLPEIAERLRCIPRILVVLNQKNGRLLDREELADLAQDVLVVAWRKLEGYEGLSALEGWAYGICALEYRNAVRRKRRRRQEAEVLATRGAAPGAIAVDADPWAFEEVHEGLRRIGREEAQVIRLKHFEGRTFEEIGAALGISPNTAKARYYRGMVELRPLLDRGKDE